MADELETPQADDTQAPDAGALQEELDKARKALKEANREAAERRKKLEQYEREESERKQAEMTELDRLRAQVEEANKAAESARTESRNTLIRAAFVSEAAKQGALYPDDVFRLADASGVEVLDDGAVTGVAEAVKALVDAGRVPLAGKIPAPKLDGGAGSNERPGQGPKLTPLETELAQKMGLSAEQYLKNKLAIGQRQQE